MPSTRTPIKQRRQQPRLDRLVIQRGTMIEAHAGLGAALGRVIRRIARQRLAQTPPEKFREQIGVIQRSHDHLRRIADGDKQPVIAAAVQEYIRALTAWADGAELNRCLRLAHRMAPDPLPSLADLALWLQDDNVGCQTGLLRLPGRLLFWHTEEDTTGYVDRPRLVTMAIPKGTWHAFLYPYLLPGPAFSFTAGRFLALDSLHTRRRPEIPASLSGTVAWLVWRLAHLAPAAEVIRALAPFIDGAAINEISNGDGKLVARTHEFGQGRVQSRTLPTAIGSLQFQVNMVTDRGSALGQGEALSTSERKKYEQRCQRTTVSIGRLLSKTSTDELEPKALLRLLADRRGGEYAYANDDVKSYCLGVATAEAMELHVGAGPATTADEYDPQFSF